MAGAALGGPPRKDSRRRDGHGTCGAVIDVLEIVVRVDEGEPGDEAVEPGGHLPELGPSIGGLGDRDERAACAPPIASS